MNSAQLLFISNQQMTSRNDVLCTAKSILLLARVYVYVSVSVEMLSWRCFKAYLMCPCDVCAYLI